MPRVKPIDLAHRKLFHTIQSDLETYESSKPRHLLTYERAFRSGLPGKFHRSSQLALKRRMERARVILIGDFHPFRQSQKGFLRLLESSGKPAGKCVVALECFRRIHQSSLDEYLAGLITLGELRDKTDLQKSWPFPWDGYAQILQFMRLQKIRGLALDVNFPHGGAAGLRQRDQEAARLIANFLKSRPAMSVFAMVGEHHLGRAHLPALLRKELPKQELLVIHQDLPEYHWKARPDAHHRMTFLELGESEYCVLGSLPWVKLRSYLDWIEGDGSLTDSVHELDAAELIRNYACILAESLDLGAPGSCDLRLIGPDSMRKNSRQLRRLYPGIHDEHLSFSRKFQRTLFVREANTVLLPLITTNALSEAATYSLLSSLGPPSQGKLPGAWKQVPVFALGFLGSKILNPRRRCQLIPELARHPKAGAHFRVAAAALAELAAWNSKSAGKPLLAGADRWEAARLAGTWLGDSLFRSAMSRKDPVATARRWFLEPESLTRFRIPAPLRSPGRARNRRKSLSR